VLLIVVALAGCGGAQAGPAGPLKTLSVEAPKPSEEFKMAVERSCFEGTVQLHLNVRPLHQGRAGLEERRVLERNIERAVVSELERVKPPVEFASAMRRILAYRRALIHELNRSIALVRLGETAKLRALERSASLLRAKLARVAKGVGLKECAKVG
jgi:hypothetical protein